MTRKSISKELRRRVMDRFSGNCAYCGTNIKDGKFQIDHFVAFKRGGTDDFENLYPACCSCNNYKNTFTVEQFRNELKQQVDRLKKYSVNYRLATRFGLVKPTGNDVKFYYELINENQDGEK